MEFNKSDPVYIEERFAEIDVELVRQELKKINDQQEKIPASMKKVLQTKNLPVKIAKITKTVSGPQAEYKQATQRA